MIIVDSSVIIGILRGEPDSDAWLDEPDQQYAMSAVNLQEVLVKTHSLELDQPTVEALIDRLQLDIVPHHEEHARYAASLWPMVQHRGLSLGDRACLALARILNAPVLTADRMWVDIDIGVNIRFVR
jgi:PIN domain nuclease of toxin-antitoxin system